MENPFAVPPPLFSRKRKAPATENDVDKKDASFFCADTYHTYSVDGNVHEAEKFLDEHTRRAAIRTALSSNSPNKAPAKPRATTAATTAAPTAATSASVVMNIKPVATAVASVAPVVPKQARHLADVIMERAIKERSREMAQVENISKRLSTIPLTDHATYMRLHQKRTAALAGGIPPLLALTAEEHATLSRLEVTAKQEQRLFEVDLERLAKNDKLAEYTAVPPHIDRLFDQRLQVARNQVMHLYPRYYETQVLVSLNSSSLSAAERSASAMKHLQEVAVEGSGAVLHEDVLKAQSNTTLDPQATGVSIDDGPVHEAAAVWRAISADPTAERLMEKHDCDVAMSSATLLAIFDTAADGVNAPSLGWTVPVKSRVCMVQGKPRRQLYLDRPVPNGHVCAREKIAAMSHPLAIQALTKSSGKLERRVTYHVWQMGDIKLLVRTATFVYVQVSTTKTTKPVCVSLKPDYMPLGIPERITASELRCLWLSSWIRGGSALLLGRMSPKTSTVTSWSKYSLSTLLGSLGSAGFPDTFEPLDYFAVVHTVLTSLQGLTGANYLLRCPMRRQDKETERQLHILRAAIDGGEHQAPEDQSLRFDLFHHINSCGQITHEPMGYVLPAWQPVPDRIPYTFRTGSHCTEFLQRGICEREGEGGSCDNVHLRLIFFKDGIKWVFEDHSTGASAKRANANPRKGGKRVFPKLTPSFPFCRGTKQLQGSKLLANPTATISCDKPQECQLPHLSLAAIAERVADEALRAARSRRRHHKARNRRFNQPRGGDGNRDNHDNHDNYDDWD